MARVGEKDVLWTIGDLGRMADGNCTVQWGKTTVFAAAVCDTVRSREWETLPLQVQYREAVSATARFPRSWMRREGTPSDREICIGRSIDRALRPLFPIHFPQSIGVTASVLSADDSDVDPDIVAIHAASGALMCSDVPWNGPIGVCRVALVDNNLVAHPSVRDLVNAEFVLTFIGTRKRVVMIEAKGREVEIKQVHAALDLAHMECQQMIDCQHELCEQIQVTKRKTVCGGADATAAMRVLDMALPFFEDIYSAPRDKAIRSSLRAKARRDIEERLEELGASRSDQTRRPGSGCVSPTDLTFALMMTENKVLREQIMDKGKRPDGRLVHDLRPITCRMDVLPVVHGSALFERGDTQSLCTATVGNGADMQRVAGLFGEGQRPFTLQYNFPSFAVNEISKFHGASRRERGHSMLAVLENAISGVMPTSEDFCFPVRVTAETMASNGSSSMAAVCGASMALTDAGVPIRSPVAGISIGLMTEFEKTYVEHEACMAPDRSVGNIGVVADIEGIEDNYGDMDFKIASTACGITAMQLDVKLPGGVEMATVKSALEHSKKPLAKILGCMDSGMSNRETKKFPLYARVDIDAEAIGVVVGKDGTRAREIEAETSARLVFADQGHVTIYGPSPESFEKAKARILDLQGLSIHEGEVYPAKVLRILDYGAYVELPNGFHVLLHVSQLSHQRITSIDEVLTEGQCLDLKCIGRDTNGNVILSRKALLHE